MRTHGWGGSAPRNDEEAIARIIEAAGELLDQGGEEPTILAVAKRLSVTRQTVYRYFTGTTVMLQATAESAARVFLADLARSIEGVHDLPEAVVEAVATTIERVRSNPRFRVLFSEDLRGLFLIEVTSSSAVEAGRSIVDEFDVDWQGWSEEDRDQLVEHMLRTLQSFIVDPGEPPRCGKDLRDYLRRWIAPACLPSGRA